MFSSNRAECFCNSGWNLEWMGWIGQGYSCVARAAIEIATSDVYSQIRQADEIFV
jgi:hypothetical protein